MKTTKSGYGINNGHRYVAHERQLAALTSFVASAAAITELAVSYGETGEENY